MKKALLSLLLFFILCPWAAVKAQDQPVPPAREMRSTWVATVWRLDWPRTVLTSTGNQSQITRQKNELIQMLDSLAINNFNAINFQVRSRSDAMYQSSYEPWSSDLVSERGMDPGWDPLAFAVEECHKRGMECHAWVNPYRFESVAHQWDGTPRNHRESHPDWIMDVTDSNGSTASILNPGLPEVTQFICDIISEIVQNYDVDGVLFDDYFYLGGTTTAHDGTLYNAYKDAGGTLSIGDWRRENVNNMVHAVYTTIKDLKPWVRFGISPAGIACTSSTVANQYGVNPCPTGSDWQYSSIYSDPLAWISRQDLDFISPQVYWTIGASTAYGKAVKWWSEIAHKWDRHLYVSHSITSLLGSSSFAPEHAPGLSELENTLMSADALAALPGNNEPDYASGPNSTEFSEYADEIDLNREYNLDNAPGSVFYSAKYTYLNAKLFGHYLKIKKFTTPCLLPPMPWLSVAMPEPVENVQHSGTSLSWTGRENMRYSIYAFPTSLQAADRVRTPEYLVGVSYSPSYTLDAKYASGYIVGVCAYDRFGNESYLALPGEPVGNLAAPSLLVPSVSGSAEAPFDFSWSSVDNAVEYIVEIATDQAMTQLIDQRATTANSISSNAFRQLPMEQVLYWRVRACAPGYRDGRSASSPFTITELRITSPAAGFVAESLTPTFVYSIPDREVTLEICTDMKFSDRDIVYTNTHAGSHRLPDFTLAAGTEYFARALYQRNSEDLISAIVSFKTPDVEPVVPAIAFPTAGGDFFADSHVVLEPIAGPYQIRVEISASETFPPRASYSTAMVDTQTLTDPKTGEEIRISTKPLVDGETYYVHARAVYRHLDGSGNTTAYSDPVMFIYRANSGVTEASVASKLIVAANIITAAAEVEDVEVVDVAGRTVAAIGTMTEGQTAALTLAPGVYIVKARGLNAIKIQLN